VFHDTQRTVGTIEMMVDERLQRGRKSLGIPDIDDGGEATHIVYGNARQMVGNEFEGLWRGHLPHAGLRRNRSIFLCLVCRL